MGQPDDLRAAASERLASMIERLRVLVSCESPSRDLAGLGACADLLIAYGDFALGRPAHRIVNDGVPHLLWRAPDPVVLVLGHFDTVWPIGTIAKWPLTVRDGRASGPGVFDMKAGIVQLLTAVELVADRLRVSVLLTGDEEVGSVTSRELIEEEARRARAVLVCEPSADGGAAKIARKGLAGYRVTVIGQAAHAGLEPERGVNAAVELAHQVLAVETLAAPGAETTVIPTVLAAGSTSNTVPERGVLTVDVRGWTRDELQRVDGAIRGLLPRLPRAAIAVDGGINRYPLEPAMALPLLEVAQAAARDLGLPRLEGVRSGGGSDGNLTAALGVPTLDGLGAVGGHPHGRDEWVDVAAMPDRTALLAAIINHLCGPGSATTPASDATRAPR